jgi:hypothetical protein
VPLYPIADDTAGIASTPVPGLFLVRGGRPGVLEYAIIRLLVCLVLQRAVDRGHLEQVLYQVRG